MPLYPLTLLHLEEKGLLILENDITQDEVIHLSMCSFHFHAYGLAIDNIESIKGFLGNGTFISLKKNQINPKEQLIWEAIKGAAPFFSIITEIKLKTIQSNPIKVIEGFANLDELSEIIQLSEEFPENISLQWI